MTNQDSDISQAIETLRQRIGQDLTIVGHHYQADSVIRHTDRRGDSLELARSIPTLNSPYVMFCGVYFMAESAALLAREDQEVHLPEPSAECSMALMSPAPLLYAVMDKLQAGGRRIIPLAYVNSTLAVKAFTGEHGGAVCTSANAQTMFSWAMEQGDAVLFLPDKNLGMNTANTYGLPEDKRYILSLKDNGNCMDLERAGASRLLLWPGFCSIHTRFNTRQIERVRSEYPGVVVAVHPECTPEVVAASDVSGSTSFLIRYADGLPDGSTLAIGTEINLVERLAKRHQGRITILPLVESECTHMAQTTEKKLLSALQALAESRESGLPSRYRVTIDPNVAEQAAKALHRMLDVCK